MLFVLLGVDALGLCQQLSALLLELILRLRHALVAHGLVLGRVGLHLRAVDGDMPEPDEPCLLTEPEHLHEQPRERLQMLLAELCDAVVVGVLIAGQHTKRDLLVGRPFDASRGRLAHAVRVDQ